jgi:hypothetical protein
MVIRSLRFAVIGHERKRDERLGPSTPLRAGETGETRAEGRRQQDDTATRRHGDAAKKLQRSEDSKQCRYPLLVIRYSGVLLL